MRKPLVIALLVLLVLILIGAAVGYRMWNKPFENIEKAKTDMAVSADALLKEFTADEAAATAKFLNKKIEVKGKVASFKDNASGQLTVFLETSDAMATVQCSFDIHAKGEKPTLTKGQEVVIKGICVGFLIDVQLDRCVLVK